MTLGIMTFNLKYLIMKLSINITQHFVSQHKGLNYDTQYDPQFEGLKDLIMTRDINDTQHNDTQHM